MTYVIYAYEIATNELVGTFTPIQQGLAFGEYGRLARIASKGNPDLYYTVESADGDNVMAVYQNGFWAMDGHPPNDVADLG